MNLPARSASFPFFLSKQKWNVFRQKRRLSVLCLCRAIKVITMEVIIKIELGLYDAALVLLLNNDWRLPIDYSRPFSHMPFILSSITRSLLVPIYDAGLVAFRNHIFMVGEKLISHYLLLTRIYRFASILASWFS